MEALVPVLLVAGVFSYYFFPWAWRRRAQLLKGALLCLPLVLLQTYLDDTLSTAVALMLGLPGIGMLAGFSAAGQQKSAPTHPVVAGLIAVIPYPLLSIATIWIVSEIRPAYLSFAGWGGPGGDLMLLSIFGAPFMLAAGAIGGAMATAINHLRRKPSAPPAD